MLNLRATAVAGAALTLAVTLAGCSSPSAEPGVTQRTITSEGASASSTPSPTLDASKLGPKFVPARADGSKPFGAYFIFVTPNAPIVYDTGLVVQVDRLGTVKAGQYATVNGTKASKYRKYKITVTNNTKAQVKVFLFNVTAQDGDAEAGQLFDSEQGLGNAPSTPLLSGRHTSWSVAFGESTDAPVVSVTPVENDTQDAPAVFSN